MWEGAGVVASARKLIGATNPLAAEPGTIRGDFAIEVGRNIVHGSDSVENGERETGVRAHWAKKSTRVAVESAATVAAAAACCMSGVCVAHGADLHFIFTGRLHHAMCCTAALWFTEGINSWEQTMTPWLKE